MQAFDYVRPTTVDEAVSILARHGDQARILSGGTDLIVALREGRRQVQVVVDIKALSETAELAYSPQAGLRLGAAVPCYRIYGDTAVAAAYPGLIDAAYRGELRVVLINTDPADDYHVARGDRIAQLVIQRVEQVEWNVVAELGGIDRGGGFGHSGR